MNKTFALSLVAACTSFVMLGCMAPEGEALDEGENVGTAEQALGDPPTGGNHFCPGCFWAADTQQAYRTMGAGALNRGGGRLPILAISPVYRDQVLQNAIECGLGQDQSVRDPVTGALYKGHWGLAPSWEGAALTTSQRRWVTGCMAQRLNAFGVAVEILLEGNVSPITTDAAYDAAFPWDESTVWGDLFSSVAPLGGPHDVPFELYACWDSDLQLSCPSPDMESEWLDYRICDSSPICGLVVRGSCSDLAVCKVDIAGYPVCSTPTGTVSETVHVQLTGGTCVPAP